MIDFFQRLSAKTKTYLGVALGLLILLVWMEGGFEHKASPGNTAKGETHLNASNERVTVIRQETDDLMAWPAEVKALTLTQIAPKYPSRILEIPVRSGDPIKRGQVLVHLDDNDAKARLGQAKSALLSADAQASRARADAHRIHNLFEKEAATHQDYDTAIAASKSGEALASEAREAVAQAEALQNEMFLRAPFDGFVVSRKLEPGDMAIPGNAILTVQQSQVLRIEAAIPDSCSAGLQLGATLRAKIATPALETTAQVDEMEPAADPKTHTVLIKARLPANTPVQPGAFGWLEQGCGHAAILLVPQNAVLHSGQLELVHIVIDDRAQIRHIKTGKPFGDLIEVLSGLNEGDVILKKGQP